VSKDIFLPVLLAAVIVLQSACSDRAANPAADRSETAPQAAPSEQGGIRWFEGTVDEAFAAAIEQQKPVFLYWGEEWCPYCNRLQSTVFVRDEFVALSHEFIALDLGTDTEEKIQYGERFGIRGFPTVIVFNPEGEPLTRIAGGADIEQYARVLETTLGSIRPVGELVQSVQAGEELTPGEWTLLVNYSWRDEPGRALAEETDLHAVLRMLSDRAPAEPASAKRRLKMQELTAWLSDDDRDASLAPAYHDFLQMVLADDGMIRENLNSIAFNADEIIPLVVPDDQQAAVCDRILAELDIALEDPTTVPLKRIELLMGWLNVSTASLGEGQTLSEQQVEWLKQQAEAARRDLPREQFHSGLYFLSRLYPQAGLIDEARDVIRQGIEESDAAYYFMIRLASLEASEGNNDEALAWYKKAWDASRGPKTRARWGSAYLGRLVQFSPDNVAAIRDTSLQLLAEITDQDDWLQNHQRTISRLSDTLLEWSGATASEERDAVLDDIRSALQDHCSKADMANEKTATCEQLLAPA
jgi:thioredoxin-related protein/tetratricopeptide (TPR) repeat protein